MDRPDAMAISRRRFLQALAAWGASTPVPHPCPFARSSALGAAYAVNLGNNLWSIGNDLIEQRLAFSGGGLFTVSLRHKASGRDWCSAVSSPVFYLKEEGAELSSAAGWALVGAEMSSSADDASLALIVQHDSRPIRMQAQVHIRADSPVAQMWTSYENVGENARQLQAQSFVSLVLNPVGPLEAVWVGPFSWHPAYTNDAFVVHRETPSSGQQRHLVIGPYAADDASDTGNPAVYRPSCGWFVFHRPAIEAGLFCGVEWSGACDARLALNGSGQGELSIEHWRPAFAHAVAPAEQFLSPIAFVGLFDGPLDEATHLTHQLAKRHYLPARPPLRAPASAEVPYVAADTWGYGPNIDEAGLRAFVDRAAEMGVEAITIDEGWEARIGDWTSHPVRFPNGLRATVDAIHAKGMAAGLWFAFANVDPHSPIARDHPDWLAWQAGSPIEGSFGSQVLCLSHSAARAWVASEFDRIIDEFNVDYFVQDFETIARCDDPSHGHQTGDGEYRNVLALWDLIAGVRARHPGVRIENNWSGGRVMDFGMLRLYDAALCDDYNQAARNRGASFGATHFFPPAFVSKYMGAEAIPFDYQTRSCFFGGPWNLMIDLPAHSAAALASAVSAYKGLRSIIRDGRVVHLAAPSFSGTGFDRIQISWDAVQAVEAGAQRAVILVGRGLAGPDVFSVRPRELDPGAEYDLVGMSGASYGRRTGSDLMSNGITVSLPERAHETIVLTQLTRRVFLPAITQ